MDLDSFGHFLRQSYFHDLKEPCLAINNPVSNVGVSILIVIQNGICISISAVNTCIKHQCCKLRELTPIFVMSNSDATILQEELKYRISG